MKRVTSFRRQIAHVTEKEKLYYKMLCY